MKKSGKEIIESMKASAIYYGNPSLIIKKIEYGIDDYMICVSFPDAKIHELKIHTSLSGISYVKLYNKRISLSDCIKVDI